MPLDKAVILAAGLGNRISKVGATPKPLLTLDGTPAGTPGSVTFLDWHIERLSAAGVREIYLVGNHRTFETKLSATPKAGTTVRWILNPSEDLSRSGSGHSAWYAWQSAHGILDGASSVVLMDADILYEPKVVDVLADEAHAAGTKGASSVTLVCSVFRESNEEVMVFGHDHEARLHGKGLLHTGLTGDLECYGEATGMVLFAPGDHALVREATDWCMRYSTAKEKSEHEDITQRLMNVGRVRVASFKDLLFMECDTPDEYEYLTKEMYPRVRQRV